MEIEKTLITPSMAKRLMENNTNNRNLSPGRVSKYVQDMINGNWLEDTGELIKISKSGVILDGQHRLQSIINSGKAINIHIAHNVNDDVFQVIDTGKSRSASDVFKIAGVKNATQIASMVQQYNNYIMNRSNAGKVTIENQLSAKGLLEFYREDTEYWDNVNSFAIKLYNRFQKIMIHSEIGLFVAIFDNVDSNKSREFFRQVCEGVDVSSNSVIVLRNKLISDKLNPKTKMPPSFRRALIIKAWNAFYSGTEIKILRYNPDMDVYPEVLGLNRKN